MASEPKSPPTRSSLTQGLPFRKSLQMEQRMMCWTISLSLDRRRNSFPTVGRSVRHLDLTILTRVKFSMLLLYFAGSLKKDRLNPCSIVTQQTMWKTPKMWLLRVVRSKRLNYQLFWTKTFWVFETQDFRINDDNQPAPGNILTATNAINDGMFRAWEIEPFDARRCVMAVAMCSQEHYYLVPMHRCILSPWASSSTFWLWSTTSKQSFSMQHFIWKKRLCYEAYAGCLWGASIGRWGRSTQLVDPGFKYTTPWFINHFKFWHRLMTTTTTDTPWSHWRRALLPKISWKIRVFTFLLAVVEVDARLAYQFITESDPLTQLQFRSLLVKWLVDFSFVNNLTIESDQGGVQRLWLPFVV